jgi:hypothetical protein
LWVKKVSQPDSTGWRPSEVSLALKVSAPGSGEPELALLRLRTRVNGQIRRLDLPTIEHTKWTPARDKLLKRLCIADPQLSSQQLALQLGRTP